MFGPGHPDSATADNNAGVMLQSLRDYPTSTKFFERACATQEEILGKDHVLTATGYHVLAKAYTLQGDFAKALNAERVAFGVFEKKVRLSDSIYRNGIFIKTPRETLSLAPKTRGQRKVTCGSKN